MRRTALAFALAAALAGPLAGQETAPMVLRLPPSARVAALGDAFVAGRGPEVLFSNPARLGLDLGTFAGVARFGDAATLAALATTTQFGPVAFGMGVQWLDYGASPGVFPTPPGALASHGGVNARSVAGTAGLAVRVIGFRVGTAIKYTEELVAASKGGGVAFDVGVSRGLGRFEIALAAQHLGSDLEVGAERAELPSRVTLGAAVSPFRVGPFVEIRPVASVSRERNGRITPAGGAEVLYVPLEGFSFAARAGVRRPEQSAPATRREAWSVGLSAGMDRVSVDYAFEPMPGPGAAHRVGIRIQ